jgi:cytochrome c peroxidase
VTRRRGPGARAGVAAALLLVPLASVAGGPPRADDAVDRRALARVERPPLGLPAVRIPAEDPPTIAKIALGRKLFFDRRLSFNNTMSCGMCHIPEQGFTNNELRTPVGVAGRSLPRNAPTILNAAYFDRLFHDGRERALETQPISPILAANEMANPSMGWLLAKLDSLPDYAGLFERAFGGGPTADRLGMALATWERTMLAGDSQFDRWRYGGRADALTPLEQEGYALFTGRAGCDRCHPIGKQFALFTDQQFHDTGIGYSGALDAADDTTRVPIEVSPNVLVPLSRAVVRSVGEPPRPDLGRFEVTLDPQDRWRFKTPSLRNVALTAPYMHDGSIATLEEVVRFYARGGIPHPGLDPMIQPIALSDDSVRALVAFLRSLTSEDIEALRADARSVNVGN